LVTIFDKIIHKLKNGGAQQNVIFKLLTQSSSREVDVQFELLKAYGCPIIEKNNMLFLETDLTNYKEQIFTVVDVETNGSFPFKGDQIIEIGAIKYQNGKIIDKFESLVFAKKIPEYVSKITNITTADLKNAPDIKTVLKKFRVFLKDSVFVAHDIKFDYKFVSESLTKNNLGKLTNRKLCTIDLAKRTIDSERYGLKYLIELLNIDMDTTHRALADAYTASVVLEYSFKNIPKNIITTEDLIDFSKSDNKINPD